MVTKEESISLVYRYKNLELDFSRYQYKNRFLYMEEPNAIECAKIAVDGIIKALCDIIEISESDSVFKEVNQSVLYWQEVKQELEEM
jgi:hypothetical protein